jgi:aminoglycoside phosphotransferase (APT) family kinase protein
MIDITEIKLEVLQQSIPELHHATAIEPIHKGLSTDQKAIIHLPENEKQLLRVFDIAEFEQKQMEYEAISALRGYDIKCSMALACGKLLDYNLAYMLLTYIEGEDAREELPRLTEAEQYQIGFDAGRELLKMHLLKAPSHISPWYDRKAVKHRECLGEYNKLNVRFNHDSKVMAFIDEHMGLMKDCPNLFQHDDIHIGNVIIKEHQFAGLIDFNRYDWGDPVHDFLKMGMFNRQLSIPFSIGQVDGYHASSRAPNELFWKRYALYLAMSLFDSVVWVHEFEPENLISLIGKIDVILDDHCNFDQVKPGWYIE